MIKQIQYYIAILVLAVAACNRAASTDEIPIDSTPPGAIENLEVVALEGQAGLTIRWTAPSDVDAYGETIRAAAYELRLTNEAITTDSAFEAIACDPCPAAPTPADPGTQEEITLGGLEEDRDYHVAIRAKDQAELSGPIASAGPIKTADLTPPGAPVNFAAVNTQRGNQIELTWTNPPDSDLAELRLYRTEDGTSPPVSIEPLARFDTIPLAETYMDNDVANNIPYTYTLYACDDGMPVHCTAAPTAAAMASNDLPPGAVTDCAVTPLYDEDRTLRVTWTDPPDADLVKIGIWRKDTDSFDTPDTEGEPLAYVDPGTETYDDSGLALAQIKYYTMVTFDENGFGEATTCSGTALECRYDGEPSGCEPGSGCSPEGICIEKPSIDNLNPNRGQAGMVIAVSGTHLGGPSAEVSVTFSGSDATIGERSDTRISITVPGLPVQCTPDADCIVDVVVSVDTIASDPIGFTYSAEQDPYINGFDPPIQTPNEMLTISGLAFGNERSEITIYFTGADDSRVSAPARALRQMGENLWDLDVRVPDEARSGPVSLTVGDIESNSVEGFRVRYGSEGTFALDGAYPQDMHFNAGGDHIFAMGLEGEIEAYTLPDPLGQPVLDEEYFSGVTGGALADSVLPRRFDVTQNGQRFYIATGGDHAMVILDRERGTYFSFTGYHHSSGCNTTEEAKYHDVAVSPAQDVVAAIDRNLQELHRIEVSTIDAGDSVRVCTALPGTPRDLAWSDDGLTLAVAGDEEGSGWFKAFFLPRDMSVIYELDSIETDEPIYHVTSLGNGLFASSAKDDANSIYLLSVMSDGSISEQTVDLPFTSDVQGLATDPDGKRLVAGLADGSLAVMEDASLSNPALSIYSGFDDDAIPLIPTGRGRLWGYHPLSGSIYAAAFEMPEPTPLQFDSTFYNPGDAFNLAASGVANDHELDLNVSGIPWPFDVQEANTLSGLVPLDAKTGRASLVKAGQPSAASISVAVGISNQLDIRRGFGYEDGSDVFIAAAEVPSTNHAILLNRTPALIVLVDTDAESDTYLEVIAQSDPDRYAFSFSNPNRMVLGPDNKAYVSFGIYVARFATTPADGDLQMEITSGSGDFVDPRMAPCTGECDGLLVTGDGRWMIVAERDGSALYAVDLENIPGGTSEFGADVSESYSSGDSRCSLVAMEAGGSPYRFLKIDHQSGRLATIEFNGSSFSTVASSTIPSPINAAYGQSDAGIWLDLHNLNNSGPSVSYYPLSGNSIADLPESILRLDSYSGGIDNVVAQRIAIKDDRQRIAAASSKSGELRLFDSPFERVPTIHQMAIPSRCVWWQNDRLFIQQSDSSDLFALTF